MRKMNVNEDVVGELKSLVGHLRLCSMQYLSHVYWLRIENPT